MRSSSYEIEAGNRPKESLSANPMLFNDSIIFLTSLILSFTKKLLQLFDFHSGGSSQPDRP